MSLRSLRPLFAAVILAALCSACGSDDDSPPGGAQADAAVLPSIDAAPAPPDAAPVDAGVDAAPAEGDHVARCSAMEEDGMCHIDGEGVCTPADALACQRRCEAILDGFTDECGQCFVYGTNPDPLPDILIGGGEYCRGSISYHWPYCTAECDGNDELTTALDRVAKCDALCEPIGGQAPDVACASDVQSACRLECRDRFEGLSSRCAACMVALSYPPQVYPTEGGPACSREVWAPTADCAAYCL